jgi:hypothetical protein
MKNVWQLYYDLSAFDFMYCIVLKDGLRRHIDGVRFDDIWIVADYVIDGLAYGYSQETIRRLQFMKKQSWGNFDGPLWYEVELLTNKINREPNRPIVDVISVYNKFCKMYSSPYPMAIIK